MTVMVTMIAVAELESESELIEQEIIIEDDFYFTTFDYDIL